MLLHNLGLNNLIANFCNLLQGDAAAVTSGASNLWEEPKVRI